MSHVRAKFFVSAIGQRTHSPGGEPGYEVTMQPVSGGSAENENFFKYTPYGELKIGTINPEVAKRLEVGKTYYLDITPTD